MTRPSLPSTEITTTMAEKSLTTPFSAPWLRSLRKGLGDENGQPILMTGFKPSEAQNRHIAAEIKRLKGLLSPSRDSDREIAVELAKMLAVFPSQDQSGAPAKLRIDAYIEALSHLPAWAIGEARARILRGDIVIGHRFMPSPPELVRAVGTVTRPLRDDLADLKRIQQAAAGNEPSAEERRRISKAFDELAVSLGGKRPETPEAAATRARQVLAERCAEMGVSIDDLPDRKSGMRRLEPEGAYR